MKDSSDESVFEKQRDQTLESASGIGNSKGVPVTQRIANILASIEDDVFALDRNWNFIYLNNRVAKNWGFKPAELIGRNFWDNFPRFVGTAVEKIFKEAMAKREIRRFEWEAIYASGFRELTVFPSVEGITVYAKDVTERRKAEEALIESEERFFKAFDYNPAAMTISRLPDRVWSDVNESFLRLTEYDRGEVIGHTPTELMMFNNDAVERSKIVDTLQAQGSITDYELSARTKTGRLITLLFSGVIVRIKHQDHILAMYIDITERKEAEKELEQYRKHLEQLVDEKTKQLKDAERLATIGATAGMVGHDIRNPLQAIANDIFLVKSDLSSIPECDTQKGIKESLDGVEQNIEYINKIVADLQDYARPISPTVKEIDFRMLCDEVILKAHVPSKIGASCLIGKNAKYVLVDPELLRRVVNNLVINAIQAMPQGGKLTLKAYRQEPYFVMKVSDTGVGIPEALKAKLFTPLFTTKAKGQGFGLAVVKRVTELMGGTVTVESQEKKGTTFTIRLPVPKSRR